MAEAHSYQGQFADGPPLGKFAPSGGSAAHEVASVGAGMSALAPLHALIDPAYPAALRTVAEWLYLQLVEDQAQGLTPELQALRLAERLSAEGGGVALYIPKGVSFHATVRDREMYALYKVHNTKELARRYKLTDVRVRQICGALLVAERAARQGNLALEDS